MRDNKTALVLSAGGMFGAYQAGAYKAIAELAPPDIVVGASVGALNGWAIASGCSPDDLIERWLDPSAGDTLKLFPKHGWRQRMVRSCAFARAGGGNLVRDYEPRIPFGVVVVELPGLHPRLVQYPDVLAAHLQATCSIPLFLPSVKIDGKRYLDGGLFEKLPIWAALEMGATRIIAIDSLPKVGKWWLHLGIDLAHIFKPPAAVSAGSGSDDHFPVGNAGDTDDAVFWKRANIERWVDLGMRDAARALPADSRLFTLNSILNP